MDAQHFAVGAYIVLLFAFAISVTASIVLLFILNWKLKWLVGREQEMAAYSWAVLLAQEDERARLSRDLHDTVVQDLRFLVIEVGRIGRMEDAATRKESSTEAAALLSQLLRRVRNTCDYLVPPDFRFRSVQEALGQLCHDFNERTGIACHTDIIEDPEAGVLDKEKRLQIFRIVQEALVNIEKHAGATLVSVIFHRDSDGGVHAGVFDDGRGFNQGDIPADNIYRAKLGLRGIRERAEFLGGELAVTSEPGEGTSVRLYIPPVQGKADEHSAG
ncbi:MAG: sensor histidine kinase [Treponema sp.]|nr:sensor histidine kinase [Treponema sp.]